MPRAPAASADPLALAGSPASSLPGEFGDLARFEVRIRARSPISSAESAADLADDVVRSAEDVGRGEAQDRPSGGDEPVLPAQVVDEHVSLAVDVTVELDQDPPVRPGQVRPPQRGPG